MDTYRSGLKVDRRSSSSPNKAFITDVTTEGSSPNLYMNVPGFGLRTIWNCGHTALLLPTEPLQIQSVDFLPGSQSRLAVTVDIPAVGIESLWLTAAAITWGLFPPPVMAAISGPT